MCVLDLVLLQTLHDLGAAVLNSYQNALQFVSLYLFFPLIRRYCILPKNANAHCSSKYVSSPGCCSIPVYKSISSAGYSIIIIRFHHTLSLGSAICPWCHQDVLKRGPTLHRCSRLGFIHQPRQQRRLYSCHTNNTQMDPFRLEGWHQLLTRKWLAIFIQMAESWSSYICAWARRTNRCWNSKRCLQDRRDYPQEHRFHDVFCRRQESEFFTIKVSQPKLLVAESIRSRLLWQRLRRRSRPKRGARKKIQIWGTSCQRASFLSLPVAWQWKKIRKVGSL